MKPSFPILLAVAWFSAVSSSGAAEPKHYELIPENAVIGISVRSIEDVEKKGDALAERTEWKEQRPSKLFGELLRNIGVAAGLDEAGSAAIMIANPKDCGVENPFAGWDFFKLVVGAIPFKDRDDIAGNFGLKKGELKPETITKADQNELLLYARGNHLFLSVNEKAIKSVLKPKPCTVLLTDKQQRPLADADMFLFLSPRSLGDEWKDFQDNLKRALPDAEHGGDEALNKQLTDAMASARHFFATLRLHEDGASFSAIATLDAKNNDGAAKLLDSLKGPDQGASVKGLPEGRAIVVEAFQGEGTKNVAVARALLYLLANLPGPSTDKSNLMHSTDRALYLGVFGEMWKLLKGNRIAVYQNDDETKKGLFSAVAILDVDDPAKLLKEIRLMMRLGDGKDLKLGKGSEKDDVALVARLIRDLGDEEFEVRKTATTKLALMGEPVLPFLEKALNADDLEVRHRAESLKEDIVRSAEERRKELLDSKLPRPVRPAFTFFPAAQTVDGQQIDVIQVKLHDADVTAKMKQLLGPDWDKIRLAVHGKQVIVLVGSDEKLLQGALANVKENRPGLAKTKDIEQFEKIAVPGRRTELHLSLHTLSALIQAKDLKEPGKGATVPALTSLGLAADGESLQLDLWLPAMELKGLFADWR